jgi:hypothetical protein
MELISLRDQSTDYPGHQPFPPTVAATDIGSDFHLLATTRANALLVGNEPATSKLWNMLWPTLRKPVRWWDARAMPFPSQQDGTLILERVDEMEPLAQQRLFEWLDDPRRATRVLTASPRPLFPKVQSGDFLEKLYYRLNVVLLVI